MRCLRYLLVPAGLALAGTGTAAATPGMLGASHSANIETSRADDGVTEARHTYRHWRHSYRYYYGPPYPQPYYFGPPGTTYGAPRTGDCYIDSLNGRVCSTR